MKDYIGLNIKYLCENNFLSQDEFGAKFGLKKSVIGTYVRGISHPKVEVMQKICEEYNISLDDFINHDLYLKNQGYTAISDSNKISEPQSPLYSTEKEALLKTIEAQEQTIAAMKVTIDTLMKK
ncbi:helix-turn-helix domain-containing protein [Flavobacterium zepuense]|uniref:Helix-turn-helix domain-containing protein n=1 Tax=Flavobacterium zepuense TaxID=2593302 RepID=A0A552V0D5_9FLAO|nr:helix-turn-helix transcriptional regulator [Flavobacterium zepuense]TRW23892.1 helix-turn-helix domain-containing protein [Flavobacterium zepuense]